MSIGMTALMFGLAIFLAIYAVAAPQVQLPRDEITEDIFADRVSTDPTKRTAFDRYVRPALRNFLPQTPMSALLKARGSNKVTELLVRSGNPWNLQPEEFVGLRWLAAIAGFFAGMFAAITEFLPSTPVEAGMVGGAALGYMLPRVLLDRERGKRKKAAAQGLPEALDLLVITLNSGMNFQPALAEVTGRLPEGLIKDELTRVGNDLLSGKTLQRSLTDFARRAPSDDVEGFCKAVVQSERLGVDVSETLQAQSNAARTNYEAIIDKRTAKLPTTLMFPIIGFMLPALMIIIMAPSLSSIGDAF